MNRIRQFFWLVGGDTLIRLVRQLKAGLVGLCYKVKGKPDKSRHCYITCAGKTDGIGAQVQAVFSTMLFAQEFGMVYAHTPFGKIWSDHSSEEWDDFFGLGEGEISVNDIGVESLNVVYVNHPLFIGFNDNTLYVVEHCHSFVDSGSNSELYSTMLDRFVDKYQSSSKGEYKSFYEDGKLNVAIHARRGDVSKEGVHSERYTDNSYYKMLLEDVQRVLDNLGIESSIHLYSQGEVKDFDELKGVNVNYHLDECVFTTFHNLVSSDVIITSKSTYSYTAALLSKAIVVYEPFWHKPLSEWLPTIWDNNKHILVFNEAELRRRLKAW